MTEILKPSDASAQKIMVSLVVPFVNERDTITSLVKAQCSALNESNVNYEIILIDDGSTDDGALIAANEASNNEHVRFIQFTRNFGKASALSAGMAKARGDIIITMDADMQDDPIEIPRFLEAIQQGNDVVSGWKKERHDPIGKRLPSGIFNKMVQLTFGIGIHDINCGFKAYTRRAAKALDLYGELHRFTPALLFANGYSVTEIVVKHNSREYGESKYGYSRLFKGLLDLLSVKLMTKYKARPLHFFGQIALPFGLLGIGILIYLTVLWFAGYGPIGNRPLLLFGILFVITATQLLGIGLTAELLQTNRLSEQDKYVVEAEYGFDDLDGVSDKN
jgi:glycosyltransferase involved in cell wall biosynthesis